MKDENKSKEILINELNVLRKVKNDYEIIFDTVPITIWFKDNKNNLLRVNKGVLDSLGLERSEVEGKSCYELFPEEGEKYFQDDLEVINSKNPKLGIIEPLQTEKGKKIWVKTDKFPYYDQKGNVAGIVLYATDISDNKKREEIILRQSKEILDLSTPVVQIIEGIVLAPLIGVLDSQRTEKFMENLLNTIVSSQSQVALVDITGVPTLDTKTAQHLIETVMAVKLVGAKVILTGISPAIAQTLVHLGIDLTEVITRSSLSSGLKIGLEIIGLLINDKKRVK